MKTQIKIPFILFFLLLSFSAYSQYLPTIKSNCEWNTYSWFEIAYNTTFQVSGDSLVNDTAYYKLILYPTGYGGGTFEEIKLIREDSLSKSIYQRLNNIDFKIYDYSLNIGDTFHYENPQWVNYQIDLVLDSITDNVYSVNGQYLEINIDPLKAYYFHDAIMPWDNNIIWVEGIGSLAGILFSYTDWQGGEEGETLLCHYNKNAERDFHYIYYEEPEDCQGYVGLLENKYERKVQVYPNPLEGSTNININGKNILSVQLIDIHGKLIITKHNKNDHLELEIPEIQKGLYLLKIQFEDNQYITKKIVKR